MNTTTRAPLDHLSGFPLTIDPGEPDHLNPRPLQPTGLERVSDIRSYMRNQAYE